MEVFNDIKKLKDTLQKQKSLGKSIGLVPTMGALHNGHLALVNASKSQCDVTVCSIYVNPTQFDNATDLQQYPKSLDSDLKLLNSYDCDVVFTPSDILMYGGDNKINLDFGDMESVMEGSYRLGHFGGVGIVVAKLFNIISPTHAFFGQKDLQQCAIISCLVNELMFDLEIITVPIVREESGLAMSSRNSRLSKVGLSEATIFYKNLKEASLDLKKGMTISAVKNKINRNFANSNTKLEYVEIVDIETMHPIEGLISNVPTAICIAGYVEGVRLIDNIVLEMKEAKRC